MTALRGYECQTHSLTLTNKRAELDPKTKHTEQIEEEEDKEELEDQLLTTEDQVLSPEEISN